MKKISDFIYHNSDILVTVFILAAVVSVIYWRMGQVMNYSSYLAAGKSEAPVIDIDFSGIDLAPEEDPDQPRPQTGEENPPVSFDENFRSPAEITVTMTAADDYQTAVRRTAEAYGFSDEDYLTFYNLLWTKGVEIGVDEGKIKSGKYLIPAGSTTEQILRIITNTETE